MKRLFDLLLATTLLLLLSPIMLVVALAVLIVHGRPIFFCQQRPGLHGKLFTIYKFRTMTESYDQAGNELADGMRLTRLGTVLRSLSLDELPELVNVLKGDMSLVGPRPLLVEYLPHYTAEERRRHDVRPGITGLAQIHGRNHVPWDERLALDVWYVKNRNLMLDIHILFKTIWAVIKKDGVSADPDQVETNLREERSQVAGEAAPEKIYSQPILH